MPRYSVVWYRKVGNTEKELPRPTRKVALQITRNHTFGNPLLRSLVSGNKRCRAPFSAGRLFITSLHAVVTGQHISKSHRLFLALLLHVLQGYMAGLKMVTRILLRNMLARGTFVLVRKGLPVDLVAGVRGSLYIPVTNDAGQQRVKEKKKRSASSRRENPAEDGTRCCAPAVPVASIFPILSS